MHKIVEIADDLFVNVKRSKNVARHNDGVWVLVLNERNAEKPSMACILPNRDAQTIVKIIEQQITTQQQTKNRLN